MKKLTAICSIFILTACSPVKNNKSEQVVNDYIGSDSIAYSYKTSLTNKGNKEYIYSNRSLNQTDKYINVNDLFQILSDSIAMFNYDTCILTSTRDTFNDSKIHQLKEYRIKGYGTYILFNHEVGIIYVKNKSGLTDFGTVFTK